MKRSILVGLEVLKTYPVLTALHEKLLSQFMAPDAPKMAVATVHFKRSVATVGITAPFFETAHTCITVECRGDKAQKAEAAFQRKMILDVMTQAVELLEGRAIAPEVETRHVQFYGGGNN